MPAPLTVRNNTVELVARRFARGRNRHVYADPAPTPGYQGVPVQPEQIENPYKADLSVATILRS